MRRTPSRTGLRRVGRALLVFAVLLVPRETVAQAREYELKAAFLLGFAKFVEWPAEAFASPGDPIVLGVAGEDPFGPVLDRLARGRTAQGRSFTVKRFRRPERVERCHILFIAGSEDPGEWLAALDQLRPGGVLTVGEGEAFRPRGAISFLIEQRKVRLAVNLDRVEAAGLRVSSKLLAVAQVVSRRWKDDEP